MKINMNQYLEGAFKQFPIKHVGYEPDRRLPFISLDDGTIFYGKGKRSKKFMEVFLVGILNIVKDLDFRYFQKKRTITQHLHYQYKPGDVVVELGAFMGYYSMHVAKRVGPTGRVIAVEMIPENYEILKLNLETNYPETATAVHCGVHKEKGTCSAYLGEEQIASFREDVIKRFVPKVTEITVEMNTVDNILIENNVTDVDLMIIQVNGNELDVLHGMRNSIENVKNLAIAAPYNSEEVDHQTFIADYLTENGFEVTIVTPWVFAKRCNTSSAERQV